MSIGFDGYLSDKLYVYNYYKHVLYFKRLKKVHHTRERVVIF